MKVTGTSTENDEAVRAAEAARDPGPFGDRAPVPLFDFGPPEEER